MVKFSLHGSQLVRGKGGQLQRTSKRRGRRLLGRRAQPSSLGSPRPPPTSFATLLLLPPLPPHPPAWPPAGRGAASLLSAAVPSRRSLSCAAGLCAGTPPVAATMGTVAVEASADTLFDMAEVWVEGVWLLLWLHGDCVEGTAPVSVWDGRGCWRGRGVKPTIARLEGVDAAFWCCTVVFSGSIFFFYNFVLQSLTCLPLSSFTLVFSFFCSHGGGCDRHCGGDPTRWPSTPRAATAGWSSRVASTT